MNIHYLQHVSFETLSCLEDWAYKPGNRVTATRFFEDDRLPFVDAFDMLIVLGGPMSIGDEAKYPWLKKEKELIAKAIAKGKMVLGICLGSQLVAEVLGSKVYANKEKEIGWFPVQIPDSISSPLNIIPSETMVFHWHGDTFDLPNSATLLASTTVCMNQAYFVNHNILGLQFHLEANEKSMAEFIAHGKSELEQGGNFVQTEAELQAGVAIYAAANQKYLIEILNRWVSLNA